MSVRVEPDAQPDIVLTAAEINPVDLIEPPRPTPPLRLRTLTDHVLQIAMLGGYLTRSHNPLSRLHGRLAWPRPPG